MISEVHPLDYYPAEETGDELTDSLALIDKARAALAQAETLSDIGAVREVAERARRYASAARLGRAAENHAARLRIEAERKAGALLAEAPKHRGNPDVVRSEHPTALPPKLSDLGISKQQSSDWQRLAKVPEDRFDAHVQEVARTGKPLTTEGVVQVARQIEKAERAAEPKPIVDPSSVPARIEWGDARAMPLDRDTVDLIVTSPPYSLDKPYSEGGDVQPTEWRRFLYAALVDMLRVTKPHGRLALNVPLDTTLGGCRPIYSTAVQMAMSAGWTYQATITWHEGNTTKGNRSLGSVNSAARPHPVDSSEMIAIFSKGEWGPSSENPDTIAPEQWQEYGRGPWSFSGETRPWEDHPAPFPMELPRRLIRYLSRRDDVVLDPFAGSGTTLVAALQEGRQAIGYDVSQAYVDSALRRIAAEGFDHADRAAPSTDLGGPGAAHAAGVRAGVRREGAPEGLAGGLCGGLHRGTADPEQQELVQAGSAGLADPFPHGTRVLVEIHGRRVFGTYLTIQENGAGPVLGVDVTTNGGDRSISTGMHWVERELVYPLESGSVSSPSSVVEETEPGDDYPCIADMPCADCGGEVLIPDAETDRKIAVHLADGNRVELSCDACSADPHDVGAAAGGV